MRWLTTPGSLFRRVLSWETAMLPWKLHVVKPELPIPTKLQSFPKASKSGEKALRLAADYTGSRKNVRND